MARPGGGPENLRPPWKPGESGNPNGPRAKTKPLIRPLRELIETPIGPEHALWPELNGAQRRRFKGQTPGKVVAIVAILQAIKGDPIARAWIADRIEGRVELALKGDVQGELTIVIKQYAELESHLAMEELEPTTGPVGHG